MVAACVDEAGVRVDVRVDTAMERGVDMDSTSGSVVRSPSFFF